MKTLIAYATRYGTTETCAGLLAEQLGKGCTLVNLGKEAAPDPAGFDVVVLGSSIQAGDILKPVKQWATDNLQQLLDKKPGLYVCCWDDAEKGLEYLSQSFPDQLVARAVSGCFGGELKYEGMNFIHRFALKRITRIKESTSRIDTAAIKKFASELKKKK